MTEQSPQEKYGTLRGIAVLLMLAGAGVMTIGGLAIGNGFWGTQTSSTSTIVSIAGGVAAIPLGLLLLAASESIHVILDTEANTRKNADAMITLIADVRELTTILNRMDYHLQRSANATERLANTVVPPAIKSR